MKYLLLIFNREDEWTRLPPSEREVVMGRLAAFENELKSKGALVDRGELAPSADGHVISLTPRGRVATPGVSSQTEENEVLTSYYVVDAPSAEQAMEWAKKLPIVTGKIEVRPLAAE